MCVCIYIVFNINFKCFVNLASEIAKTSSLMKGVLIEDNGNLYFIHLTKYL